MNTTIARAVNRPPAFQVGDRVVVIEDRFLTNSPLDRKLKARLAKQVGQRGTVRAVSEIGGAGGIPMYSVRLDHSRQASVFFNGQLRHLDVVEKLGELAARKPSNSTGRRASPRRGEA